MRVWGVLGLPNLDDERNRVVHAKKNRLPLTKRWKKLHRGLIDISRCSLYDLTIGIVCQAMHQ